MTATSRDGEFEAIAAVLTATQRGRRFLEEYARRRRDEDVTRLIAAAERIEAQAGAGQAERERGRQEAERAAEMARQLAEALKELRPLAAARMRANALEARAADEGSALERRFAALVALEDSLDRAIGLKLSG